MFKKSLKNLKIRTLGLTKKNIKFLSEKREKGEKKRYLGEKKERKKRLLSKPIVISKLTMPLTKLSR